MKGDEGLYNFLLIYFDYSAILISCITPTLLLMDIRYTGVLRTANQTCVNVYDVIEMCAPAAPPIMLRIRTRSLNTNPKPLTLTLFLTVTGTKFLKENKTGQK